MECTWPTQRDINIAKHTAVDLDIPDKESTIPETSELRILRITTMPVRCSNALRELHCDEGI